MKGKLSLKWLILLLFSSLAVVLIFGYSILSARYFILGIDSALLGNMIQVVESFADSTPVEQQRQLNHFSGYQISQDWQQMPETIQLNYQQPEHVGALLKGVDGERPRWGKPPELLHFVMRVEHRGATYYISRSLTRENASPLVSHHAEQSRRLLLIISLSILLVLGLVSYFVMKQVERPIAALGQWARTRSTENLHDSLPDFTYPELNRMAALIRDSMLSVQQSLERERRFLRFSSHELRTPISVIRNNVELLNRLLEQNSNPGLPRLEDIIQRIDRAGLKMKHLTETLLWLGRENDESPRMNDLDLESLVRELITDSSYLLNHKQIDLAVTTSPHQLTLAEIPARIVLGNLIRNAFQHSHQGTIHIIQRADIVEIINTPGKEDRSIDDPGFGLGLQLIEQLSLKLNWSFTQTMTGNRYYTQIRFRT